VAPSTKSAGPPHETGDRRRHLRFRSPTSTKKNHSDPGSPPRSSQHPSAEYHQRTRWNNSQKMTNTRPKLEVAVGYLSKQQSRHRRTDAFFLDEHCKDS
jgi:hypothetical protein